MALQPNRQSVAALAVSAILTATVLSYEGVNLDAYIPVKGDVPTIGVGTTVYPDGKPVEIGDSITRTQAEDYLKHDLDKFKVGMMKCIKAPLYQYEFESYLSLTYNIGISGFCNSSIPVKLNRGDYQAACSTILQFNKMKDSSKPRVMNPRTGKLEWQYKVIKGLDNRRKSEYNTCIGGSN